jgi:hypothetical protein
MRAFAASLLRVLLAIGFLAGVTLDLACAAAMPVPISAQPPAMFHTADHGHDHAPVSDHQHHHGKLAGAPCCHAIGVTAPVLPLGQDLMPIPASHGRVFYWASAGRLSDRAIVPALGPPRQG